MRDSQIVGLTYSISQEIRTRPRRAPPCCGYAIVHNEFAWSIYPYSSGLLRRHWGNRLIATVPAKQARWTWENQSLHNHNKAQQSKNRAHTSWDILYTPTNTRERNTPRVHLLICTDGHTQHALKYTCAYTYMCNWSIKKKYIHTQKK